MNYYKDKQNLPSFAFNDNDALQDFSLILLKSNYLSSAKSRITEESIPGRNGNQLLDEEGFENLTIDCECIIDSEVDATKDLARDIRKWLKTPREYKKLCFSEDPDFYFEAICINKLDIAEVFEQLGELMITFSCKPLRRLFKGDESINDIKANTKVRNPGYRSQPLIEIQGSGDITLKINKQELILKNVNDNIFIECEEEFRNAYRIDPVTKKESFENSKMFSEFPYLEEGDNLITWTGNVVSLKITPRWVIL